MFLDHFHAIYERGNPAGRLASTGSTAKYATPEEEKTKPEKKKQRMNQN